VRRLAQTVSANHVKWLAETVKGVADVDRMVNLPSRAKSFLSTRKKDAGTLAKSGFARHLRTEIGMGDA